MTFLLSKLEIINLLEYIKMKCFHGGSILTRFLFQNKKRGYAMRNLLLGTTALAASARLSTSIALADVSLSGGYEFNYSSQDSGMPSSGL